MDKDKNKNLISVLLVVLLIVGVYQFVSSDMGVSLLRIGASGEGKPLKAECVSNSTIKLSWGVDKDAAYNILQRRFASADKEWTSIFKGDILKNSTYLDKGISLDTPYEYRVFLSPNRQSEVVSITCSSR